VQIARDSRDAHWAAHGGRPGAVRPLVAASVGPYGRIGISIGVGRVNDAITDRASTDWRGAACPPTRSCASRAVGTAGTVGGTMPAGTHPSRRWDGRPRRRSPRGGGALGPYSGDRRRVGERAWGACRAPARGGPRRWGAPRPGVRLT
jgi:hypothetical protein